MPKPIESEAATSLSEAFRAVDALMNFALLVEDGALDFHARETIGQAQKVLREYILKKGEEIKEKFIQDGLYGKRIR